jgi:hypothetical protein
MAPTASRPLDRLVMWVFGSACAAYQRRRQAKRTQLAKAARKARKAQRRAERKMAREAQAKQQVRKPQPIPQSPVVRAEAAQLVIAQRAMEMRRKARHEKRLPLYRQQAHQRAS